MVDRRQKKQFGDPIVVLNHVSKGSLNCDGYDRIDMISRV